MTKHAILPKASAAAIEAHLRMLTETIGVRLAGSDAERAAAEYLAGAGAALPGTAVAIEEFPVWERHVTRESLEIRIGDQWHVFGCSLFGAAPSTEGRVIEAPLVFFDTATGYQRESLDHLKGAAVVHLHARDRSGKGVADARIFREMNDGIRSRCGVIIQNTTGGPGLPIDKRITSLDASPEMASLNMGSVVFFHQGHAGVTVDVQNGRPIRGLVPCKIPVRNTGNICQVRGFQDQHRLDVRPQAGCAQGSAAAQGVSCCSNSLRVDDRKCFFSLRCPVCQIMDGGIHVLNTDVHPALEALKGVLNVPARVFSR